MGQPLSLVNIGAMSLGSIDQESYEALDVAMNELGRKRKKREKEAKIQSDLEINGEVRLNKWRQVDLVSRFTIWPR